MTRYGMAIDKKRCIACNRCSMMCKAEHSLPNGVLWNRGMTTTSEKVLVPEGSYPDNLSMELFTLACQHCDNPACVDVCPTGASIKREDGIVVVDYELCIGCKSCIAACPYDQVRTYVEEPEYELGFKSGDYSVSDIKSATVSKCTFCVERVDRGETPACVEVCFARYWGDLDDPESEISQVISSREYDKLLEDQGTGPAVYYLK